MAARTPATAATAATAAAPAAPASDDVPLAHAEFADLEAIDPAPAGGPLLPRVLRLRHLRLTWWQRVLFGDLPIAVGLLLALADAASAWVIVGFPVSVYAMVKLHDVVAGRLSTAAVAGGAPGGGAPGGGPPPGRIPADGTAGESGGGPSPGRRNPGRRDHCD